MVRLASLVTFVGAATYNTYKRLSGFLNPEMASIPADYASLFSFLNQDPEVRQWLDTAEQESLSGDLSEEREWNTAFLAYMGFDPIRLIKAMNRNSNIYSDMKVTVSIETPDGNTITYSNQETMSSDIRMLILIFCVRGSITEKITSRSIDELKTILDWFSAKYNMNTTVRKAGERIGLEVITIPRICATFASRSTDLYHQGIARQIFSQVALGFNEIVSVPKALFSSFLPALILRSLYKPNLTIHPLLFLAAVVTDETLHRKGKDFTVLIDILAYYKTSYNSAVVNDAGRIIAYVRYGLLTPDQTSFTPDLIQASQGAPALIRALRPLDPNLPGVLAEIQTDLC